MRSSPVFATVQQVRDGPGARYLIRLQLCGKFAQTRCEMEQGLGFDAVQRGASESGRGPNPVFHHPKVKQVIFVTRNPMLKMAAEAELSR